MANPAGKSPTEAFCYEKFTRPSQQIRVVKLRPSTGPGSLIECELEIVDRSSKPVYDCLSYTWGDTTQLSTILVNGKCLQVTENLVTALTSLRDWNHEKYHRNEFIWIDAICINQKDDDEKGHQVQAMRDIYTDAAQVVIWLGSETIESKRGIWILQHLMDKFPISPDASSQKKESLLTEFAKELKEFDGEDDKYTVGIQELFSRPWWIRVWIVQEAAVAKVAWIACGTDALDFDCIRKLYQYANDLSGLHYSEDTSKWRLKIALMLANLTLTTRALLYNWLGNDTTLLDALEMMYVGNNVHATDPRDRIYA